MQSQSKRPKTKKQVAHTTHTHTRAHNSSFSHYSLPLLLHRHILLPRHRRRVQIAEFNAIFGSRGFLVLVRSLHVNFSSFRQNRNERERFGRII